MKVLIINGSPRVNGNTSIAINEMTKIFHAEGVETDTVQVGNGDIRGCIACGQCARAGKCVFDDVVNELAPRFEAADGLVIASPVYYASANATLIAVLDRLFYSTHFDKGQVSAVQEGAAARRHLMNSTNISQSPTCRLRPASTGTASTDGSRDRQTWMRKGSRPCVCLRGTCHF